MKKILFLVCLLLCLLLAGCGPQEKIPQTAVRFCTR